ncbi:MAG: isoprenylcysteine carboxylmethyltransferase family protein [Ectothiorhodospiraceae bacterium]|nr:isoprenylcysteine carboxylmethyltransferase family protein [Ectothiorhodospiraceae bacterium]
MRFIILPPVVMVFTAVLMVALHKYAPIGHLWQSPYRWDGIVLLVLGLGVAQWHARLFKRLNTNIDTFGEPDTLTTEGLFSVSRNPMYLGFVIALTGLAILLGSVSPFLGVIGFALLANHWYIPYEERRMLEKFGRQYLEYRARVRRWL